MRETRYQVYMVMEYYDMDLHTALQQRHEKVYPYMLHQGECKSILQQILLGMQYMHSKGYMHRGTYVC